MNYHLRSLCVVVFHAACVVLAGGASPALARTVDLASAGAIPGDPTPITALLQRLIDEASAAGGGTVVVPTGTFISKPVQLRSHVTLRNAGSWTCKLHGCDGVRIHAVRIHSHEGYNNGITLDNVHFTLRHPDARPALAFEDAHAVDLRNLRFNSDLSDPEAV